MSGARRPSSGQRYMGVDAAGPRGWVAVLLDDAGFVGAIRGGLADLVQWAEPVAAVGVDIPIGGSPDGGRLADRAAYDFVGPRRSSVFPAPPAAAIELDDYAEANRRLAASGSPKMSRQAWALVPKMREAAGLAVTDSRLHEVHPEVSFCAMQQSHLRWPKKSWNGLMERRRLLASQGIELPELIDTVGTCPADDVLDAAAAAWSARRIATGTARTLPSEPPRHDGRTVAIWY